jgi:hypothetical protein
VKEAAVIEYATAMSALPVDVPEALFATLRAHFDEVQLVELTAAVAWENYRARFNHALGMDAEGFDTGASCSIVRSEIKAPAPTREEVRTPPVG